MTIYVLYLRFISPLGNLEMGNNIAVVHLDPKIAERFITTHKFNQDTDWTFY